MDILEIVWRGIRVLLGFPSGSTDAEPYAAGQDIAAAVIAVVVLALVVGGGGLVCVCGVRLE